MARKARYSISVPTWVCPHCGFVHKPADLLRVNSDDLLCKQCNQTFPAKQDGVQPEHRRDSERQQSEPDAKGAGKQRAGSWKQAKAQFQAETGPAFSG